jgi:hypothetical protein
LKGSVSAAERPRTLRRLRKVYSPAGGDSEMGNGANESGKQLLNQQEVFVTAEDSNYRLMADREQSDDTNLSLMSPFDEQEEWAKISEIMASFGTGLVRESIFVSELEKEFQIRLGKGNCSFTGPSIYLLPNSFYSTLLVVYKTISFLLQHTLYPYYIFIVHANVFYQ